MVIIQRRGLSQFVANLDKFQPTLDFKYKKIMREINEVSGLTAKKLLHPFLDEMYEKLVLKRIREREDNGVVDMMEVRGILELYQILIDQIKDFGDKNKLVNTFLKTFNQIEPEINKIKAIERILEVNLESLYEIYKTPLPNNRKEPFKTFLKRNGFHKKLEYLHESKEIHKQMIEIVVSNMNVYLNKRKEKDYKEGIWVSEMKDWFSREWERHELWFEVDQKNDDFYIIRGEYKAKFPKKHSVILKTFVVMDRQYFGNRCKQ